MTKRTSKPQPSLALDSASPITVTGKRSRPPSTLRSVDETSERLGCSTKTVSRLMKSRALPFYRIRGRVLISDADIAAFLDRNRSD
jgi:excisionase family DNA binding protein